MCKRTAAVVLTIIFCVFLMPFPVFGEVWELRGDDHPGCTPPQLVGSNTVTVGDTVSFLVNRDNFDWDSMAEEAGWIFTPRDLELLNYLAIEVYMQPTPYFTSPRMEVEGGQLYLCVTAAMAGQNIPMRICMWQEQSHESIAFEGLFTIQDAGSGNPGGGEGPGGNPGGGDGGPGGGPGDGNGGGEPGGNPGDGDGDGEPGDGGSTGNGGGSDGNGGDTGTVEWAVTGINPLFSLQEQIDNNIGDIRLRAGEHLQIPLPANAFLWSNNGGAEERQPEDQELTANMLGKAAVSCAVSVDGKAKVLDGVSIVDSTNGGIAIQLQAAQLILSLDDIAFTGQISLKYRGQSTAGATAAVAGTVPVSVLAVSPGESNIVLQQGVVLEPTETVRNMEIGLEGGVSIRQTVYAGQRYTGIALRESNPQSQLEIEVEEMVTLYMLGLDGAVKLDQETTRYAYAADGTYLGKTDSFLPYQDTYYISETPGSSSTAQSSSARESKSDSRKNIQEGVAPIFTNGEETRGQEEGFPEKAEDEFLPDNPHTGK